MNLDNVKSDAQHAAGRIRKQGLSKNRSRNLGLAGALGSIPFLLGVILVALRFDAVRGQLFRVWPQSRKMVERLYSRRMKRAEQGFGAMRERTPYGEA